MATANSEKKGPVSKTYIGPRRHRIGDSIFFEDHGINGTFTTSKEREQKLIESDPLFGTKIFPG